MGPFDWIARKNWKWFMRTILMGGDPEVGHEEPYAHQSARVDPCL